MLSCTAWTAAPSGVKSLISRRLAGIVARGIHSPAKNISGKNSMVPITPADRPVGANRAAAEAGAQERARLALRTLSPREREVVLAIARGHTNAEIAAELYMSVPTVTAHITHILTKLQLGNRTQIALLAHDADLA